jgi:hypothetical protein
MSKAEFRSKVIALQLESLPKLEYLELLNELVREYINSPGS